DLKGLLREAWRAGAMSHEAYLRAADLAPVKGSRLTAGRALTGAELDRMFAACGGWGPLLRDRHRATLALGAYCGLRRAEIVSVEREHLRDDTLTVIGKGNKEREVPLARVARERLVPWLERRGTGPGPVLVTTHRGGHITETPLSVSAVVLCLQEIAEKAGVTDFSAHDLRRTFITNLLGKGVDLRTVQRLAGHDDPMTTTLYDRSGLARAREAVEMLNPKEE
ncbi:MAG: site-specific integrase, partial [Candidatus Omnitrophica bacterium]|nr:site-specific integrase [Candidatus Omnitrophota bacterium]